MKARRTFNSGCSSSAHLGAGTITANEKDMIALPIGRLCRSRRYIRSTLRSACWDRTTINDTTRRMFCGRYRGEPSRRWSCSHHIRRPAEDRARYRYWLGQEKLSVAGQKEPLLQRLSFHLHPFILNVMMIRARGR